MTQCQDMEQQNVINVEVNYKRFKATLIKFNTLTHLYKESSLELI